MTGVADLLLPHEEDRASTMQGPTSRSLYDSDNPASDMWIDVASTSRVRDLGLCYRAWIALGSGINMTESCPFIPLRERLFFEEAAQLIDPEANLTVLLYT